MPNVTFDAKGTAVATGNGVTSADLTTLTISGALTNPGLTAQVAWSGTVTSPSLTWDNGGSNQAMAAVPGAGATNTTRSEIWGLVNPISGNKTLHAAWTTARDISLQGISWSNVNQTGGATSFPNGTSATAASGTNTGPVVVTSAVGNAVVGVFSTNDAGMASVDNTQSFIDNAPATMSTAGNYAAGAATVTLTATRDATSHVASAGCDIAAAAGGGGLTVAQEIPAIYQAMSGCIIGRVDA